MKGAARTKCKICGAMNHRENHYCVGCGAGRKNIQNYMIFISKH